MTTAIPPLHDGTAGVLWIVVTSLAALVLFAARLAHWRHHRRDAPAEAPAETQPSPVTAHPRADRQKYERPALSAGPEGEEPQ